MLIERVERLERCTRRECLLYFWLIPFGFYTCGGQNFRVVWSLVLLLFAYSIMQAIYPSRRNSRTFGWKAKQGVVFIYVRALPFCSPATAACVASRPIPLVSRDSFQPAADAPRTFTLYTHSLPTTPIATYLLIILITIYLLSFVVDTWIRQKVECVFFLYDMTMARLLYSYGREFPRQTIALRFAKYYNNCVAFCPIPYIYIHRRHCVFISFYT